MALDIPLSIGMARGSEYTVRHYEHGAAIFGASISVDDLVFLLKAFERRGCKFICPGIASAIGAHSVFCSKEGGEAWLKELAVGGDWLKSGDTGMSSKTIYFVLHPNSTHVEWPSVPYDPDDFGRCYRLLQKFPEWAARLSEVAVRYPEWTPMVREWAKMTALYERDLPTGMCKELYDLMTELVKEARSDRTPIDS